jgi:hypothetical protein
MPACFFKNNDMLFICEKQQAQGNKTLGGTAFSASVILTETVK